MVGLLNGFEVILVPWLQLQPDLDSSLLIKGCKKPKKWETWILLSNAVKTLSASPTSRKYLSNWLFRHSRMNARRICSTSKVTFDLVSNTLLKWLRNSERCLVCRKLFSNWKVKRWSIDTMMFKIAVRTAMNQQNNAVLLKNLGTSGGSNGTLFLGGVAGAGGGWAFWLGGTVFGTGCGPADPVDTSGPMVHRKTRIGKTDNSAQRILNIYHQLPWNHWMMDHQDEV